MSRTRASAAARRPTTPHHPRRVSGPIRPGHPRPVAARPPRVAPAPAVAAPRPRSGITGLLRALPDHRWLDTLLRSRAWIWLLGIGLGGIVAMQVSLLKMNAGIGQAVQAGAALQHDNAKLEEQVAELSSGARVSAAAADMGLVAPDAGSVGYLDVRPGLDPLRAAQNMTAPTAAARELLAGGATGTATAGAPATASTAASPTTATTTTGTTTPAASTTAGAATAGTATPAASTTAPSTTTTTPSTTTTPAPTPTPSTTTTTTPASADGTSAAAGQTAAGAAVAPAG